MIRPYLLVGVSLAWVVPTFALNSVHSERIQLDHGSSAKSIQGTIKGYGSATYLLDARADQVMTISFKTSNASSYFNVTAEGVQEALFIGATSGNGARLRLPVSGTYTVHVYLMRNAARRDEPTRFTLTIRIAD